MKIEMKILNKKFYSEESNGNHSLPSYQTAGSAAIDLVCTEDVTIYPGETKMISTGLAIWIGSADRKYLAGGFQYNEPVSYVGLILPRSGLGTKGLILANTIGLIDGDYQGELMVSAWNRHGHFFYGWPDLDDTRELLEMEPEVVGLKAGDRFAQLMFIPVIRAQFNVVKEFSNNTDRGGNGFGSTGQ